jgi:hypothetical protein
MVTLTRSHVIELDRNEIGKEYPMLAGKNNISDFIEKNFYMIKDKDGVPMLDKLIKTPGLEDIQDVQYEIIVDTKD